MTGFPVAGKAITTLPMSKGKQRTNLTTYLPANPIRILKSSHDRGHRRGNKYL